MDFRYALRALGRNPGYAAIVILILAVGIGANTAMFSIVDGVLLRALPFHEPEQLYAVQEVIPKFANIAPDFPANALHFQEWRKRWTAAGQIALIDGRTFNLTSVGEPKRVNAARISANLFPLLGVQPQIGRGFLEEEDAEGRDQAVLVSDSLWRRRFHADPAVLGRKIILNDKPYEVIGVMPAGLKLPRVSQLQSMHINDQDPEIWKPFAAAKNDLHLMGNFNFGCIVRMKKRMTASGALDELNGIEADIIRDFPEKTELRAKMSRVSNMLPLAGEGNNNLLIVEGVNVPLLERPLVDMRSVNGDYFHAMGIPLRSGRVFQGSDRLHGVAIVAESTARRVWPEENPIGKRVQFPGEGEPMMEVIGVAGDVRGNGLQKVPEQVLYIPYWLRGERATSLVIRTGMDPKSIAVAVRGELRKLDPELPVPQFRTMQDIVSASVAERKFQLSLVLVFAGIALACLGIFGVVSYTVAQRGLRRGICGGWWFGRG